MKTYCVNNKLISRFFVTIVGLLMFLYTSAQDNQRVVIENKYFQYEVDLKGNNLSFKDKSTGQDFLDHNKNSKIASISIQGKSLQAHSASFKDKLLKIGFDGISKPISIQVIEMNDRVFFEVIDYPENTESINIINIPLKLDAQPYEKFSVCILSMNLFTHVRQLPPLQSHLWASCYAKFGLKGAKVAMLGLPQEMNLPVIRDIMQHNPDIPLSKEGGAWAQLNKEGYGSYLMNFGTLTEATVDEWIKQCKDLGFNQIDSHGGRDFFQFGTLELNKEKWPDGWESFKRINEKLHKNGISHIFHTYAFFIDKNSNYVTPLPHKDLGYTRTFTLKNGISESAEEIIVNESTADISTLIGFHTENSVTLRIDDEFIEFGGITKEPPYKFTKLKRGTNGTKAVSHSPNSKARQMSERFGRFVPGPNTNLFKEIAKKHADVVNDNGFDGIYLDAIDGAAVLGGKDDFWYYGSKFVFDIAKNLKRVVGMEMSSMVHHWWHYRSRWQAWDRPVRGYKRFTDIHLASIKAPSLFLPEQIESNEWEHGIWKGHSPLIDKYAGVESGQTKLPLHLGWWGNQTWSPPQIEPTFPDDIEYLAVKMLANNAGFSQLGGVDATTLAENPLFKKAAEIFKQYETLRHQDYFNAETKKLMRQPGREFTLIKEASGAFNIKPITYNKHKVLGKNAPSSSWIVNNEFEKQPVKFRIEALMSVKAYDDADAITLTDYRHQHEFKQVDLANGVQTSLSISDDKSPAQENSAILFSRNVGATTEGAYVNFEKKFDNSMDLSKHQGLGVWVKGDGSGQLLNLSVRSPLHISHGAHGDRFIKIDFVGWKYFELVEIESSAISDYIWPNDSHFYVYDSYRHTIDFGMIESIQIWNNNLEKDKSVKTQIGPIKALPLIPSVFKNPALIIAGQKITLPITFESGMYVELDQMGKCTVYGSKGELVQEVILTDQIPVLNNGENTIQFEFESPNQNNPRAQITIISEGAPLKNSRNINQGKQL